MLLAHWAARRPSTQAVVSPAGERTFAELNAEANRLAALLGARGLRAGDGVVVLCTNRPEFAAVVNAVHRSGLRLTTLNWHLTADEAAYIAADCEAVAFVADHALAPVAKDVAARTPTLITRLAVGGPIEGFEPWAEALAGHDPSDPANPVLGSSMLYTSGTTGRPKGVYRRRPAPASAKVISLFGYREGDRHLCTGPLYHAAPLAFSLSAPLQAGVGVTLMPAWDPVEALRLIEADRVTHTHMVPTMFHRLLALPVEERERYDRSSLRHVLHGAAPCPVPLKRAVIDWLGPIVSEYYAATEGLGTFVDSPTWLAHPGTVGRPARGTVMVGDEEGKPLPTGDVGLVYLAKAADPFEYYNDPEKTARTYRQEWFTLGDIGRLDEDGWLYLTDRSANLVVTGGVNVYPAEVDGVLLTHPAVADVAVIGVPSEEWGEEVKAVVEPRPDAVAGERLAAELIDWCRQRLAHFKCPRSVDFVAELPRQDNGKIAKYRLREQYR
jgi:long-chain acyl-CoA synthetase